MHRTYPVLPTAADQPAWPRNPQCTNIQLGPVAGGRSVHPPENLASLLKLPHLLGIKIFEIKSQLKKLFNFLLYQKEQIPSFGKGLSLVGSF